MAVRQFRLPDLGEGLTEGDILAWTVRVGDTVEVNDVIAEVETVKAAVELPSPYAGRVTALHAAAGQTVPVGTAIISIETDARTDGPGDRPDADDGAGLTLVGYGPLDQGPARRRRPRAGASDGSQVPDAALDPERPRALASPPVRMLARTLGVDLAAVAATGPRGTVSRGDVNAAASAGNEPEQSVSPSRETRVPVRGVRKHMAAAVVDSAFTAPHVTVFVSCDMSATMELRDRVAARREFAGVKVSPLLFVARAVLHAIRSTPEINAVWDEPAGEIVLKHYVNLGIAAATERGLVVPRIADAHALSMLELARAMATLTETARAGRTPLAELTGATFTITNIGVFGIDSGTPILNPGEAGILAFGAVRRRPWVVGTGSDERLEPRWVTQLALSFDHRVVDGEQGSRFLADIAALLHDPGLALL